MADIPGVEWRRLAAAFGGSGGRWRDGAEPAPGSREVAGPALCDGREALPSAPSCAPPGAPGRPTSKRPPGFSRPAGALRLRGAGIRPRSEAGDRGEVPQGAEDEHRAGGRDQQEAGHVFSSFRLSHPYVSATRAVDLSDFWPSVVDSAGAGIVPRGRIRGAPGGVRGSPGSGDRRRARPVGPVRPIRPGGGRAARGSGGPPSPSGVTAFRARGPSRAFWWGRAGSPASDVTPRPAGFESRALHPGTTILAKAPGTR